MQAPRPPAPDSSAPAPVQVSVVIPTYNRAALLPAAIDSVLAQRGVVMEVIVVDDGSTDDTPQVLAAYGDRIRVLRQANAGVSAARNVGIAASSGACVAFLDSDDLWLPGKLQRQVALLDAAPPDVPCCLCNMRLVHADGREGRSFALSLISPDRPEGLWLNPLQVLATRFILFNQAVLVRRAALVSVGAFDESCRYMEDHDLALRLAALGPWAYLAEPLAVWHEGSAGSLTREALGERVALARTVHQIHLRLGPLAQALGCGARQGRQLAFERWRHGLKRRAAELMQHPRALPRAAGALLCRAEKLFDSAYTHSPWYPTMKTAALGAAADSAVREAGLVRPAH